MPSKKAEGADSSPPCEILTSLRVRVEEERDRASLPILCLALVLPPPCFWSKRQRKIMSKALLCKSVFLSEMGGDKIPSSSPLKNFLAAHGYLKVNHSPASQPLKQNRNEKACV